uniref:Uncharacterized protein n=1 Tax=Anguilla anguilla TaxID=7936 RepID=A0A0E9S8N1_ANGAN
MEGEAVHCPLKKSKVLLQSTLITFISFFLNCRRH